MEITDSGEGAVACPACGGRAREVVSDTLVCVSIIERRAPGMGWHGVRGADIVVYSGRCRAVLGERRTPGADEDGAN